MTLSMAQRTKKYIKKWNFLEKKFDVPNCVQPYFTYIVLFFSFFGYCVCAHINKLLF